MYDLIRKNLKIWPIAVVALAVTLFRSSPLDVRNAIVTYRPEDNG
jgi:hypothetical protein